MFIILGFLAVIFIVVFLHECGHFLAAKLFKIQVKRFSLGFGKVLFRIKDRSNTEYCLSILPLGGYVSFLDDQDDVISQHINKKNLFRYQPFYKKIFVVLAGPFINFFSAFLLSLFLFLHGINGIRPILGDITPFSIAAQAGLKKNSEIIRINDHETPTWGNVILKLLPHIESTTNLLVEIQDLTSGKISQHQMNLSLWKVTELNVDLLSSLGLHLPRLSAPIIISHVKKNSPAMPFLQKGDCIIAINHQPIVNHFEFFQTLKNSSGKTIQLTFMRNRKIHTQSLQIPPSGKNSYFLSDIKIEPPVLPKFMLRHIQYSFFPALGHAFSSTKELCLLQVFLMKNLLLGKIPLSQISGPIGLFKTAGDSLKNGIIAFTEFLIFMHISIGIINLLPIPGLDGGHCLILTIEKIIGTPIPEIYLTKLYFIGLFILLFLFLQGSLNDIARLFL